MVQSQDSFDIRDYALIFLLLAVSIGIIYFIQISGPTAYVTFIPGVTESETFYTPDINITCNADAIDDGNELINISLILTDENGYSIIKTTNITGNNVSTTTQFTNLYNGDYTYICEACWNESCDNTGQINFSTLYNITQPQSAPVINLTFDDSTNPWKDYSNLNHPFAEQGGISWASIDNCKWYGCADMNADFEDYISTNSKFSLNTGMAIEFWIQPTKTINGGNSQAYYGIGSENNYKFSEEGDYGLDTKWDAKNGKVGLITGASKKTSSNIWTHYFIQYDESTFKVWKNGELVVDTIQNYGDLNYSLGEKIEVGRGIYGINLVGYMDEFIVWNRANFTNAEVEQMYNSKKQGIPPELDIYVKNVTYVLPYDWNSPTNELDMSGNLDINITIKNEGQTYDTSTFNTNLVLDGSVVCSHSTSLLAGEEETFTCSWPKSAGWHSGYVIADANNDVDESSYIGGREYNNKYTVIVPMESHPRFRFTKTEWDNTLEPWFRNSTNEIGYASYNAFRTFISEDFNPSWSADNVDPRAKKGYENALGCYLNNFAPGEQCTRAMNHLQGWLVDVNNWEDGSVQSLHEVIHVAATYDLMFPSLTKEEAELYGSKIRDVCLEIYGKPNVQPHTDTDIPSPGNGKGFGLGMAGPCYVGLGDNPDNPNMIWQDPQSYSSKSTIYYWNNRIKNHLEGFKDDPEAIYPEGMLYQWYSRYHLVDLLWFLKRTGISTIPEDQQNAICSFTKEAARNILDDNYNGQTLRGDENSNWRQVSYGDTNSYEAIGSDGLHGWDVITTYGLLCDDPEIKQVALKLRNLGYYSGAQTSGAAGLYYYPLLAQETTPAQDIGDILPSYSFSKAFDRFTVRRSYNYANDTMFIFETGDDAMGGHPNANFDIFSYVYGEPFLDFNQVPYEDDVRSEVFANTISFSQSAIPGYNTDVGTAILNQYYGGQEITGSYPNFTYYPDPFRGSAKDMISVGNGNYAAIHTTQPYKTALEPVVRDFVIFDDLLVHVDKVNRSTTGPIYANWLNIYEEFSPTVQGSKLTLQRVGTDKYYSINPLWSSAGAITFSGGYSGIKYCFEKTNCAPGGKGYYGKYYHSVAGPAATTLFAHHWYRGTDDVTITLYNGTDKGVQATYPSSTTFIIMDTNSDGIINEQNYETDGWSLSIKDNVYAVSGATYVSEDAITLYQSASETDAYEDLTNPGIVNITISSESSVSVNIYLGVTGGILELDGQLVNYNNYTINSGVLYYNVPAGIHELIITKEGDGVPAVSQDSPSPFFLSNESSEVYFQCSAVDDYVIESISLLTNESGTLSYVYTESPNNKTYTLTHNLSFSNNTYEWACSATDNSSQTTMSSVRTFQVGTRPNQKPSVTLMSPADNYSTISTYANFVCNAEDFEGELDHISLLTNESGNLTPVYVVYTSVASATLIKGKALAPGNYTWTCTATDVGGVTGNTINRTIEFLVNNTPPTSSSFDGDTTNFTELISYINVSNVTLEDAAFGKILFLEPLTTIAGLDFDSAISIEGSRIEVNTTLFEQLNVSAQLTMYNVAFTNPRLLKDGEICTECTNISYVNNTFTFVVPHFSVYELEETPVSPPSTGGDDSGGGGGGGGGSSPSGGFGALPEEKPVVKEQKDNSITGKVPEETNTETQAAQEQTPKELGDAEIEVKRKDNRDDRKWFLIISGLIGALVIFTTVNREKLELMEKLQNGRKRLRSKLILGKLKVREKMNKGSMKKVKDRVKASVQKEKKMTLRHRIHHLLKLHDLSEIQEHYEKILDEYNSLSEDEKDKYYHDLLKVYEKVSNMENKVLNFKP